MNSKVIAVTVRPEPKATESHLEIELAHLANVSTTVIPSFPASYTLAKDLFLNKCCLMLVRGLKDKKEIVVESHHVLA